jgi:hypothetical protein
MLIIKKSCRGFFITKKELITRKQQCNYSKKLKKSRTARSPEIDFDGEPELKMEGDFPEFDKMKEELEKEYLKNPDQKGIFEGFDKDRKDYSVPEVNPNWENKTYTNWKKDETVKNTEKAKNIVPYKAKYRDARGESNVTIYLRGDKVCLMLANKFQYTGDDWHNLNPPPGYSKIIIDTYTLYQQNEEGHLTQFSLSFQMPFKFIINQSEVREIPLNIDIQVDHRQLPVQLHKVSVEIKDILYESKVTDSLHDSLLNLLTVIPQNMTIKSCWTCGWSHYNPFTRSSFGGLACFLGKEGMLNRNNIRGIYDIWDKMDKDVQENYLCDKWIPRTAKHKMPGKNELGDQNKLTYDFE